MGRAIPWGWLYNGATPYYKGASGPLVIRAGLGSFVVPFPYLIALAPRTGAVRT